MAPSKGGKKKFRRHESASEKAERLEKEAAEHVLAERHRQELELAKVDQRAEKEQEYTRVHSMKVNELWRAKQRTAKLEQLKTQLPVLSEGLKHTVARKDRIVQARVVDLAEAENDHAGAARAHLAVIDRLLLLQKARMAELHQRFTDHLQATQAGSEAEQQEAAAAHAWHRKELGDIQAAMLARQAEAASEARQEYEGAREEMRNRDQEEYNMLKLSLEAQVDELEKAYGTAHQAYINSTADKMTRYQQLVASDAAAARLIDKRMKLLVKLQESTSHWRTKAASNGQEWEQRNKALRAEKDKLLRTYAALKSSLDAFRSQQNTLLKELSINSTRAEGALRSKLATAEHILVLAEICRKHETQQEKILPFHTPAEALAISHPSSAGSGGARPASVDAAHMVPSTLHAASGGKPVQEADYFANLYKRYNKVVLDKVAIENVKRRILQENSALEYLLKQYMDGISVNQDVLSDRANPLLNVNQRWQSRLLTGGVEVAAEPQKDPPKAAFPDRVGTI